MGLTVLDSKTEFIQLLRKCRLVEKARAYCASWQDSHIARDYDGGVYIYNGPISPGEFNWWHSEHHRAGNDRYALAILDVAGDWREHYLPLSALQLPEPAFGPGQAAFLETVLQSGLAGEIQAFVDAWKNNAWIGMDMADTVCIYNGLPSKSLGTWINFGLEIETSYTLAVVSDHTLDWEQCLVNFNELNPPALPAIKIELNNADRKDCWI